MTEGSRRAILWVSLIIQGVLSGGNGDSVARNVGLLSVFDLAMWLSLAALALAGVVQGSSGFGFSLVAVGLVGMVMGDPKGGTIVPLFANLSITLFMLWRFRRYLRMREVGPFLIGSLAGVPLGVWLLVKVSESWVNIGLAAVLIFSGLYAMLPEHRRKDWHPIWLGIPCGLVSGALSGAFNTGGPPAVAYFGNRSLDRFSFVCSLQFVFSAAGIVRLGCLIWWGMLNMSLVTIGLIGIVLAIGGALLGNWILHRLSDLHLRIYVSLFQIVLGLIYLVRAVPAFTG